MKHIVFFSVLLFISPFILSQGNINLKKGFAAQGYDVVSYFENNPEKGNKKFTANYQNVNYIFANKKNLSAFNNNPENFLPQYGGFCAYAIAKDGKKVSVNPKTFTIINGKLYLFYNKWGVNTLDKWNKENPENLLKKADQNWEKLTR